jgi:hypothetical protein
MTYTGEDEARRRLERTPRHVDYHDSTPEIECQALICKQLQIGDNMLKIYRIETYQDKKYAEVKGFDEVRCFEASINNNGDLIFKRHEYPTSNPVKKLIISKAYTAGHWVSCTLISPEYKNTQ